MAGLIMSAAREGMEAKKSRTYLYAVLAGLAYGLGCRLAFTWKASGDWVGVMSLGFLLLAPLAVGFISSYVAARGGGRGVNVWLVLPVGATLAMVVSSFLLFWEGIICLVMLLPAALVMAVLGGAVGAYCGGRFGAAPVACVAVLPFLVAVVETRVGGVDSVREVSSAIAIAAPAEVVWGQIERVALIRPEEQQFSWSQRIGFPRPLEATISGPGVGAVRHATFAGGVLFLETVDVWERGKKLGFTIKADTANIPPGTLDEHVTIGGPYFDTLRGDYRIEPAAGGGVVLHLSSRHRVSTTFNFYAGWWTEAVMADIQDNILHVIRGRCERGARSGD